MYISIHRRKVSAEKIRFPPQLDAGERERRGGGGRGGIPLYMGCFAVLDEHVLRTNLSWRKNRCCNCWWSGWTDHASSCLCASSSPKTWNQFADVLMPTMTGGASCKCWTIQIYNDSPKALSTGVCFASVVTRILIVWKVYGIQALRFD